MHSLWLTIESNINTETGSMMAELYTISGPEKPAKSGKAKQLVILLHGLGADGSDLFGLVPYFAENLNDAHFVSLDAPFPCDMAPYGKQWFSLQVREEENMLAGIKNIAPSINAYIDDKCKELGISAENVVLLGFSQGSMLSLYVGLRRENSIAGVLAYSGALIAPQLLKSETKSSPEICLIHGEADEVVPFIAFTEAKDALEKAGISVQGYSGKDLGHGIDPAGVEIGKRFLRQALGLD